MFEATLHAADPDRQRQQRLILAAAIAVASTATVLASVATLERLGIDRVNGPRQQFELLNFSLLTAPKLDKPPPPPPDEHEAVDAGPSAGAVTIDETLEELDDDTPSDAITQPRRDNPLTGGGEAGEGGGCTGPLCKGPVNSNVIGQMCTGPTCKRSITPLPTVDAAPTEVEFSALRCLACVNPDQAALRKTVAGVQKRSGKVEVKFCVDRSGRVERSSIKVSRSFGIAAVDQVTTRAIETWRFSPLKVDGKPRRACSRTVFNIRFD